MKKIIYSIIFCITICNLATAVTNTVKYDKFSMNSTATNLSNGVTHVFGGYLFLGNYNHTLSDHTYYFHKSTSPELKELSNHEENPIITDFTCTIKLDCIDEFSREPDHDLPIAYMSLIGTHKDAYPKGYGYNIALEPFTYDYLFIDSNCYSINDLESGITITMAADKSFDTRDYEGIYILFEVNQENMPPIHFSQDSLVVFASPSGGHSGFSSIEYTYTAVPEPSTYAMIFGAIALGFVAYRRRKI